MPITALYALEKVILIATHFESRSETDTLLQFKTVNLSEAKELTIHIVGAAVTNEQLTVTVFEELLHVLPHLQQLTVVMIGPELSESHMPDANTCDKCEKVGKKMTFLSYPMLYEEYVHNTGTKNNDNHESNTNEEQPKEAQEFKRPDLVCAFNSGIHEAELTNKENSWQPALEWILQNNVPLLVTSYNAEEAELDQKYIEKLGGKVELSHQLNPFRSLHPMREPTSTNQFYFMNYYMHLVRGKTATAAQK